VADPSPALNQNTGRGFTPGGYREVWNLAWPAILTLISQTIMWTVDAAMVGRVGKVELAAVGLGGILIWTLYSAFVGLTTSINTFVSQAYGAGEMRRAGRYLAQGLYLALAASVLLLLIRTQAGAMVRLMGPALEVQPLCTAYVGIRMLSAPFFLIQYAYAHFYRGIGDTMTPLKVLAFSHALNVIGDYVLIFGVGPFPEMGVEGAAWATSGANVVAAGIFFSLGFRQSIRERFDPMSQWRVHIGDIRKLLRVGLPMAAHYFLDMGSFLVFSAYIGRMGTDALAANQIVIQVLALSFMPAQGFSIAATTLTGKYIGAGKPDIAERSTYRTIRLGLVYAGFIALLLVTLPGPLFRLFNSDPGVLAFARPLLLLAAVFQVFDALQFMCAGGLRGAGDTTIPAVIIICGAWFVFIPAAYLLGTVLDRGVVGAWAGATGYIAVVGMLMFGRLRAGRWRQIQLDATG
jgi:MATE family multidrug resistance protein